MYKRLRFISMRNCFLFSQRRWLSVQLAQTIPIFPPNIKPTNDFGSRTKSTRVRNCNYHVVLISFAYLPDESENIYIYVYSFIHIPLITAWERYYARVHVVSRVNVIILYCLIVSLFIFHQFSTLNQLTIAPVPLNRTHRLLRF